jgi:hypothetical protein
MKVRALLAGLSLALTACGGSLAPSLNPSRAPTPTSVPATATPTPAALDCGPEFTAFVGALTELDSRLSVGLNFENYGTLVGTARVAYDRVPFSTMSSDCLAVGADAEAALNDYVDANNIWNDCIQAPSCTNDSIKAKLQAKWADATKLISKVKVALA